MDYYNEGGIDYIREASPLFDTYEVNLPIECKLTVKVAICFVGMCKTIAKVRFSLVAYQVAGFVNVPFESVSVVGNWQVARTFLLIVRMWKLATLIKFPLSLFLE